MALKRRVKGVIGHTSLWRQLRMTRFRAKRLVRKMMPYLPKRILYRLLQTTYFYGYDYFDMPKDPLQESGYGSSYEDISEFQHVAELSQELFHPHRVLDVGCAKGFQVGALHSRGMEAWGMDISAYAVETAPTEVSTWLKVGRCTDIAFPAAYFDLILVLETLEHVPPIDIDRTVRELRRVARRWVWASIPSLGSNPYGRDGLIGGKIGDDLLPLYEENIIDLVPFEHLYTDVDDIPIHGHLTMASFDWWTSIFNQHGFLRRGDKERRINRELEPAGEGIWNCTVYEKIDNPAGMKCRAIQINQAFSLEDGGVWRTQPLSLPPGVHQVVLRAKLTGSGDKGPSIRRVMHCRGICGEGSVINASRVINNKELRGINRRKVLDIPMLCSISGEGEMHFEMRCEGGIEVEPMPVSEVYLYTGV